jgi:hypothetical protein
VKIVLGATKLVAESKLTAAQALLSLPNLALACWRSIF